tara:strand:- start:285 stop:1289 length:1005 start_codon:yes stop_codon:yes gene_type:complete
MSRILDVCKTRLQDNVVPGGSLSSIRKIYKGSAGNIGKFPIIVIYPSTTQFDNPYTKNEPTSGNLIPYQEVKHTIVVENFCYNLKPKSAYRQSEGILNTIKNLLHQTSQKVDFDNSGPRADIIDIEISDQQFGSPIPYKTGFIQSSSIEVTYLCGYSCWLPSTPSIPFTQITTAWKESQMKEVEEEVLKKIKECMKLDDNYYLSRVKTTGDGILPPTAKFPAIYVTAEEEIENRGLTGLNILDRVFGIDIFTKKLSTRRGRAGTVIDNINMAEELVHNLNKALTPGSLGINNGLDGRFVNNFISGIEYGEIQTNNVSLYASTLTLEGQSYQSRL